ncbi:MAG: XdhC family protein [Ferruginibacter sp.]
MKEIKAIIKAYDLIDKATTKAALATVVRVEGSSYRRTGARMLVMDNGVWVGGISGGCLEGDALKRARMAMSRSVSTLITYDTREEDAFQIGVGLGCNGVIDVLFAPLNFADEKNPVEILKSSVEAGRQTHVLITITGVEGEFNRVQSGEVIKYTGQESLQFLQNDGLLQDFTSAVDQQLSENKSAPRKFLFDDGKSIETFIEILPPEINVVIMGFQYDVYPFSRLFKEMGWRVTIVANPLKLDTAIMGVADEVVAPENFNGLLVDEHSIIILMSHDYKTDKQNLPKALATVAPYIGILGPMNRSEKIIGEHAAEGNPISAENLCRIHAPLGLDIGAVTPEEIALALAAEVKASLSKREGGFLRLRKTSIHERD